MRDVVARLPDARLVIAGDGPDRHELERAAGALGLTPHVIFTGHLPRARLDALLAAAWVQAVPSRWEEPFGLVAAEAMMRGTAVVATRGGGLTEQVRDAKPASWSPPGDPRALSDALARVLENRDLAEAMGARGRSIALAHFREDVTAEKFVALYRELCGQPGGVEPAVTRDKYP